MKSLLTLFILAVYLIACEHSKSDQLIFGRDYAQKEIESALSDTTRHNIINSKTIIIKDSVTAITIAESILFGIYGKTNVTNQKPYEIHHINNYWFLTGTLPKGRDGGTFLIILDDRNSQVIKLTHGL